MCACVCLAAWVGVHVCMRVSSCMGRGVCGRGGWVGVGRCMCACVCLAAWVGVYVGGCG